MRDRFISPSSSPTALTDSLPACIPRALALGVEFAALLVLAPPAFASCLAVLLVVDLLLAFFAVAPRLAAVRILARATLVDASLDAVRLTVAVRRLWRRIEQRVLVAGPVLLAGLLLFAGAGLAAVAGVGIAFLLFALRGRFELVAGLLAGRLHPVAALSVSALVPPLVMLVVLTVVVVTGPGAAAAAVLGVQALAVAVGLVVARFLLAAHGPAAAVGADVTSAPPVAFSALCAWTGAALLDRAIGVLPLLAVLVVALPLDAFAYAMAWRVSTTLLDAGLLLHAVVRPAVAAVTGSCLGSVSVGSASSSRSPSRLSTASAGLARRRSPAPCSGRRCSRSW